MDAQNKQRACFFLPRREYDIVIPGYSVPPPPHGHVLRDIKTILEQAGIGALKFVGTYLDSQNKQRPCYFLPKLECILIITGYSPPHGHVLRDIKVTLAQAEIGAPKFGGTYLNAQNKVRPSYFLPRFECDLVIYSAPYLRIPPLSDAAAVAHGSNLPERCGRERKSECASPDTRCLVSVELSSGSIQQAQ